METTDKISQSKDKNLLTESQIKEFTDVNLNPNSINQIFAIV